MSGFDKITARSRRSACHVTLRARTILFLAAGLMLGYDTSAKAEIFPFRTAQGNPPTALPGVTVNVHQGTGNTVEFTFVNICSSSTTARIKEIAFADPCSPGVIVLNTAALGPENTPGCTQTTPNQCPPTNDPPCVNYAVGGNLSLNFECPLGPNIVVSPVNNDGDIGKGESLTVIFNLNLQAGETAAQAFDRLLACMEAARFDPCIPGLRVGFKFQGGDPGGGGANAINIPFAFPPEDCNTNGIPDVCDISCNGFNGQCQIFSPLCGQFPSGFGVPTPTNVLATPAQVCPGGTSSLSAQTVAGNTLEWFTGSCGGQIDPFATGSPVSTGVLNQTTTFFVRAKTPAGCFSSCAQVTVTVGDTQAPVITNCHGPLTANANANCQAAVPDFTPGVTATDNCTTAGNFMITQSPTLGTLVGKGVTNITITVKDQAGNPATCQTTFTVSDTTVPVITICSQPQSASANGTCQAPVPDFTAGVVATDNCTTAGNFMITQSPTAGTVVGLGLTPVTITVKDESNNQATCQTTFTVNDTTLPVITVCPPPQSASANGNCQAAVPNFIPSVTASDNCTPALSLVITQSPTAGTLVGIGPHLVTVTVKDQANNMVTCQTMFTVNDTTPPIITSCGPDQSASANGSCMAPVPDFTAGVVASDNCSVLDRSLGAITQSPTAGTLVGIGPHTITITVQDDATPPNSATCTATFTVNDTTGPDITTCPTPVTVFADANCNALVPNLLPMVIATDNCTPAGQLIMVQDPAAGSTLMGLGTTAVHITVTDPGSLLSDTCDTSVTVVDNMPPAITQCAGPQTIPALGPNCTALIPDLRNSIAATDNCDFTVSQVPAPDTSVGLGPHDVALTVTDPANQTDTCHTTVTVVDVTPPEIGSCAPPQSVAADSNCEATVPDFTSGVSATDDCSTVPNLTVTQDPAAGTVVGLGPHTITITVSDEATPPNTSMCTTTFTVNDTTAPNFVQCAANQSASADGTCQAAVPDFTGGSLNVGDNCSSTGAGTLTITQNPLEGTLVDTGVTVVTITAQDEAGNTATCTATFTVDDTTPPSITCPAPINQLSDPDVCGATINYPPPAVSDNCANRGQCGPVTVDCVPPPGSFFPVGTTTVTCTATDCSSNTATCGFTITVNDVDTDGDGVPNCMDDCPATPPDQRPIDAAGCSCQQEQLQENPLDTDGDGIPDACDNRGGCCGDFTNSCTILSPSDCLLANGTYLGDGTTCALDSDGDGVSDCLDCCPNSPPGGNVNATGCQGVGASAGGPYRRHCPDPPGIVSVPLLGIPSGQISTCACSDGFVLSEWTTNCPGATILNPTQADATLQVDTSLSGCPLSCDVTLTVTLGCVTVSGAAAPTATNVLQASATAQVSLFPDDCNNNEIPDSEELDSDGDGVIDACEPIEPPATEVVGACCFPDSTCQATVGTSDAAAAETCAAQGGTFAGVGTDCSTTTCKCGKPQGISLLFSTLSFAPVCGSGCLTLIPLMFIGLLTLRGSRLVRRSKSDRR